MVVFTCNYCGDSVNKPKADKHVTIECKRKRYGFASLCCVDCLKDFDFRTYHSHTKCMTEEERYSAPGFKPKPSSGKGERKQTSWVDTVAILLEKPTLTKLQRSVLESISSYQNIPRKKKQFMNFMKSSFNYRITDHALLDVVFNLIESEFKAANSTTETVAKNPIKEHPNTDDSRTTENTGDDLPVENGEKSLEVKEKKKKNKKNRVGEESLLENGESGNEPEDKQASDMNGVGDNRDDDEGFTNVKKSHKKKKERKNVDVLMEITEADANVEDAEMNAQSTSNDVSFHNDDRIIAKSRGKKKHKPEKNSSVDEAVVDADESSELVIPECADPKYSAGENCEAKPERKKRKRKLDRVDAEDDVDSKRSCIETTENEIASKFSWSNVVKTLLEKSKDHELSVKRMTKKVVAEYQSFYSNDESFEDIAKKFNKKVKKLPFVIVSHDRIKLYVE